MASFAAFNASFSPFGGALSQAEVFDEDALMTAPIDELLDNNHPPPDNLVGEEEIGRAHV